MRSTALVVLLLVPQDDALRLPCTADTSICLHAGEQEHNQGAKSNLRLKGIDHILLMTFDVAPLTDRRIDEARLFLRAASPHKLKTLGLSTVAASWREGASNGPAQKGEPTFLKAASGERDWAWPGSDFHSVSFGHGGSIWFARDVREEKDGWLSVDLPAALLHAVVDGTSCGLAVSDEKGQTMHNNDLYAREQSNSAPYVLVTKSAVAKAPPSGARRWTADPPEKLVPRAILGDYRAPSAPSAAFRVLYEGETDPSRLSAGRLFDGRAITLEAARGEHVAFQVALDKPGRVAGDGWTVRRIARDPLLPADADDTFFHVERYVRKDETPGEKTLSITISGRDVPVALRVHRATIPDALSFRVSLNTYGTPQPELDFHRLAHEHRATLAIVPYSHHGNVEDGCAPETKDGAIVSWDAFDRRFGPLFDGSAFKGLPRDGAPLDHAYLPLFESWPVRIRSAYAYRGTLENHWRDAPPIEDAFPKSYADAWRAAVAAFAKHAAEKKWTTDLHVYLNNKSMYWRADRDSCWWSLDEPMFRDDFLAIAYFARLFREAARGSTLRFRIDLSRPQWRRQHLDGLVDLDVISGAYRDYPRYVFGRGEDVWVYGGLAAPGAGPGEAPRAWCLQAYLDGANGVLPWQSVGSATAWEKPEDTAILMSRDGKVFPTLRLKMLRRGQQDVELLAQLLAKLKATRDEVRGPLVEFLGGLDPDHFEFFRRSVLAALE